MQLPRRVWTWLEATQASLHAIRSELAETNIQLGRIADALAASNQRDEEKP
jgi:hypothetical protein